VNTVKNFVFYICLFYDAASISDYITSNGRMIDEERIGKCLEGNSCGLIEILFRHSPGGTQKNCKNLRQDKLVSRPEFEPISPG
jgi:hypothetical protein